MRHRCDGCEGRGWGRLLGEPVRCVVCEGRGTISTHAIARILGEEPSTLYRLAYGESMRRGTAARLVGELLALSESSRLLMRDEPSPPSVFSVFPGVLRRSAIDASWQPLEGLARGRA